jgi:uncharacterized protein
MSATDQSVNELPEFGVSVEYATGLFAALFTGPQLVPPSAWLPKLIDDDSFADAEEAQRIIGVLMDLYNAVGRRLGAEDTRLVPKPDQTDAIEAFCAGYWAGVRLQPEWEGDPRGMMLVFPLAVLAGEVSDDDLSEDLQAMPDPAAWRQGHRDRLFDHLMELYQYWAPFRGRASGTVRATKPRVGRNDPCPCGSGKKYKKCCAIAGLKGTAANDTATNDVELHSVADDEDPVIVHSPLECQITRDEVTVSIYIYRGDTDPGWLLEVEDHLGGSTCWDDPFPTDQAALDEALKTIEEEGIGSFAAGAGYK